MTGRIIFLVRPGQHDDFGHPNAVVVQFDTDYYLCVAGFTPDKAKYTAAQQAEYSLGIWGPAFAVEIDHARELTPSNPNIKLHLCGYICQTAQVMSARQLQAGRDWGALSPAAMQRLAEGLLDREQQRPYLPKKAVAALKALIKR